METWRKIPDYPGYEVSSAGQVRTYMLGAKGKILKARVHRRYKNVWLYKDGKRKELFIHTLVLSAFIGPRPHKHEAAHINGNRYDNRPENLLWVTHKENMAHKKLHGTSRYGETAGRAKLSEADVILAKQLRQSGARYIDLGKHYGVCPTTIRAAIVGINWRHLCH